MEGYDYFTNFHKDILFETFGRDLSPLLSNGDEKQVSKEQIEQDIITVRGRLLVEVMNKVQDRITDDEMDKLLSYYFQELTGREIEWDTIHDVRAQVGYSLDEGDKTLVEYMEENFKMDPVVTQNVINKCRERIMNLDWDGIAHKLFYRRDSHAMDGKIKNLVAEKKIEDAEAIKDAIINARYQIRREYEI